MMVCLFSCKLFTKDNSDQNIVEEKSTNINDTIFLGFTFGMTQDEVKERLDELVIERRISYHDKNYLYTVKYSNENTYIDGVQVPLEFYEQDGILTFDYYQNEFCQLTVKFDRPKYINSNFDWLCLDMSIENILYHKYGEPVFDTSCMFLTDFDTTIPLYGKHNNRLYFLRVYRKGNMELRRYQTGYKGVKIYQGNGTYKDTGIGNDCFLPVQMDTYYIVYRDNYRMRKKTNEDDIKKRYKEILNKRFEREKEDSTKIILDNNKKQLLKDGSLENFV